ncbi:MAG: MtrB/PioB family decaheme-associated outer membrane protein [Azonexus sp.]|jgi:MtrB/PioB family decaheme-associated outer membrane protein|nr:MtrB/PioB family decaheme-associated outer membrane protein [Azonexus sp.]
MKKMTTRATRKPLALKLITLCVSAALSQMALADSGQGVDTWLGNALNPRAVYDFETRDPDGLGQNENPRTPTGLLFVDPDTVKPWTKAGDSGWGYRGNIEVGGMSTGGDDKARGFRRYKDLKDGVYLNNFHVEAENEQSAHYLEVFGGALGRDDQYAAIRFGRYNDWRVRSFFNETRHVFSTNWKSLYANDGSGNLRLSPQAVAAGVTTVVPTTAQANAVLAATPDGEISLTRKKGGIRLDMNLGDKWKVYASYSDEKREGARPFSAGSTGGAELPEPIDYDTHDFLAGLNYADDLNQLNFSVAASLFRNNIDTLTFPQANTSGFGRYDLYPDNDYYNVKGEYGRNFPDFYKGRFTAVVSLARSEQDDKLVPWTSNGGVGGAGIWATTDALWKDHADAQIDTTLVDLAFALKPVDALDVRLRGRYYETENDTKYLGCNPNPPAGATIYTWRGCTGAWFSSPANNIDNSGGAATLAAAGTGGYFSNIPYDRKELLGSLSADYRLSNFASVNGSYEYEQIERSLREVDKTKEHKFKLGYTNRAIAEAGTLRLSYEYDHRTGTDYNSAAPYMYSASGVLLAANGIYPAAGAALWSWYGYGNNTPSSWGRKFDEADRDQHILNLRYNHIITETLDAGVNLQLRRADFDDTKQGVREQQQDSINFDLNYQPSRDTSFYAFYSYQQGKQDQRNYTSGASMGGATTNNLATCTMANGYNMALLGTGAAGDPLNCLMPDPQSRMDYNFTDRNHSIGFGLRHSFGKLMIDGSYTYTDSRSKISYSAPAGNPANVYNAANTANAATKMPDIKTITNLFQLNLIYPISKEVNARLMYLYENGKYSDWHYPDDVRNMGVSNNNVFMSDGGDENYDAHVLGLFFNVAF